MRRRRYRIGAILLIVVLITGYLGFSAVLYDRLSRVEAHCEAHPEDVNNTPTAFQREGFDTTPYLVKDFEDVRFPSRDVAISISGWFMAVEDGKVREAPTVIVVHGQNDCKKRPFVLTAAGMLHRNGFNVLAIDLRDHGESTIEDGRQAGGNEEYLDVLGAWDWLIAEKGIPQERIGLMGFSLGAATVTVAMGEEPRVAATLEDSGFADIVPIIDQGLIRIGMATIFRTGGILLGELISGDDFTSKSPISEVTRLNRRPFYIVHGDADQYIPVADANRLAATIQANGGSTEPWIVRGARHIESIFVMQEEYERRLVDFFGNALEKSG